MFTGIIEEVGEILEIRENQNNRIFKVSSSLLEELKIDQSVSHNGVCLTIFNIQKNGYLVEAVKETLDKSNLRDLDIGSRVNIERCLKIGSRLDGHFVQGHVDATAKCTDINNQNGSWLFTFSFPVQFQHLIVDKGSVTINGVSLTVVNPGTNFFSVAIIPFTYTQTNFSKLEIGQLVNIEFDILGKYIFRQLELSHNSKIAQP